MSDEAQAGGSGRESLQDQVDKLKREVESLKAQNAQQHNLNNRFQMGIEELRAAFERLEAKIKR